MKKLLLALLLLPLVCSAQKQVFNYYDWQWKPCEVGLARFVAVMQQTDSGWLRHDYYLSNNNLQMSGLYADSACKNENGFFRYYYSNGILSSYGTYVNGKKEGTWISFHSNGMMSDSGSYSNGEHIGISIGWHSNGFMSDSSFYNGDGSSVAVGWYDNGNPSFAGKYLKNKPVGKIQYFHKGGSTAALETYDDKGVLQQVLYFNEGGEKIDKALYPAREAEFAGGIEKWRKYLYKNMQFPVGLKLVNTETVTVVVTALIDEDGNVVDAYVRVPFKPPFDAEALKAVKKSPKWIPAASHNRRIRFYINQPVTFTEEE